MTVDTLPVSDLVVERGDSLTIRIGPITTRDENGIDQPVDLTVAGTKMWVTVKKAYTDTDATAEAQLTQGAGIALNDPVTVAKNYATARIPEATFADPVEYAERTKLVWDAVWELGVRHERIARGTITVVPSVTRAT